MIRKNGEPINSIKYNQEDIQKVKLNGETIWEKNSIKSCFGSGQWNDDYPWDDNETWQDA